MENLVRLFDQAFQQALQVGSCLVAVVLRDVRFLAQRQRVQPLGQRLAPVERLIVLAKEIAVVIVEQHLDLALHVASRAYVLDRGRVALTGSAGEIRDDPRLLQYLAP